MTAFVRAHARFFLVAGLFSLVVNLVGYIQSPLTYPPYLTTAPNPQQVQQATEARLRGAIPLALASTEYQIG